MRLLCLTLICLATTIPAAAGEPEYGGVARVKHQVVFDVPLERLIDVCQKNRDDLMQSTFCKIVKRDGNKVILQLGLPIGLVTKITLEQHQELNRETNETHFRSRLVASDGFLTRQDTDIRARPQGNRSVLEIEIAVVAPELKTTYVEEQIRGVIGGIEKKVKGYLAASG